MHPVIFCAVTSVGICVSISDLKEKLFCPTLFIQNERITPLLSILSMRKQQFDKISALATNQIQFQMHLLILDLL